MSLEIVPIERRHIAAFREVVDAVARERRWLAMQEAPPLARIRRVVLDNLREGAPQFVATDDGRLVGWCDVRPKTYPSQRHSGVLGMGVAAAHRGRGVGTALLQATRAAVTSEYGANHLNAAPKQFSSKVKNAQEAHEAIRPTTPYRSPQSLGSELNSQELALYRLIWQRTLASQMADATGVTVSVTGRNPR